MVEGVAAIVRDAAGANGSGDPHSPVLTAAEYALFAQVAHARRLDAGQHLFRRGEFLHHWLWLRLLSSLFIHADWLHLLGNMLFLVIFGVPAERALGFRRFLLLFVLSGIGNASTFRMIPVIFRTLHERWTANGNAADKTVAARQAGIESAAVIGFSSAIGAYGGFFIPKSFGSSIAWTGGPEMALYGFIVFYASCLAVTWWWYYRRGAETPC